ncbi:Uncharacterised protein [Mycobacterium tuberculosis]|nr:Uncharacterised protein [Mycobacterium tuberculosis]
MPSVRMRCIGGLVASGDAKVTGRAIEVTDPGRIAAMLTGRGLAADSFSDSHFFAADIAEVVLTRIEAQALVIDLWRPGQGLRTLRRA